MDYGLTFLVITYNDFARLGQRPNLANRSSLIFILA